MGLMLDTSTGEVHIRLPIDACGMSHEAHATSFICIYRDPLGMIRIDMNAVDDDLVRILDEDAVLRGYIPIEA